MENTPLVQNLIARELRPEEGDRAAARAAFRVCEKLRQPLCRLTGAAGFRSLLARAITLSRPRAPWLAELKPGPEGALNYSAEAEALCDPGEAALGGAILIGELLGLLFTLIGEALTLRLVSNVWPGADALPFDKQTDPS